MTPGSCPMCERVAVADEHVIADLRISRVRLNPDQYFPGWVFVMLRRHAEELDELGRDERAALIEDVTDTARALAAVYHPVKLNYELLGNQVRHIHWHVIPRLAGDPDPRWPVWRVPYERAVLAPDLVRERVETIRRALAGSR